MERSWVRARALLLCPSKIGGTSGRRKGQFHPVPQGLLKPLVFRRRFGGAEAGPQKRVELLLRTSGRNASAHRWRATAIHPAAASTATPRRRMPSRIWSGCAAEKLRRRWAAGVVLMSVRCIEGIPRHKSYVLAKGRFEKSLGIHALGQGHPQEQSTHGPRPGQFGRKASGQCFEHDIAAFAIDAADELHVLVEKIVARYLVSNPSGQRSTCAGPHPA